MPVQEVLLLAMTRMRSGICVAGMTHDPDPVTGLRWVRPVRDFETVLPGDMTDTHNCLFQCCNVVSLNLLKPQPDPPHVEDWLTDFVHHRPQCVRCLEGERRARFFAEHLDSAPADILVRHSRSLCLVKPEKMRAGFSLDPYSGKYEARMGFVLPGNADHPHAITFESMPVTDLKWRALGRSWLTPGDTSLTFNQAGLQTELNCEILYLTVGLSRSWKGEYWPLIVGVHTVPDYEATIDLHNL